MRSRQVKEVGGGLQTTSLTEPQQRWRLARLTSTPGSLPPPAVPSAPNQSVLIDLVPRSFTSPQQGWRLARFT